MKRRNRTKNQTSPIKSALLRQVFSITTLLVLSILFAFILSMLKNPLGSMKIASLIALLFSGAVSGIAISRKKGESGVKCALISAVIFSFIILALSLIMTGGKIGGFHFMNALCYVLISAFCALLFGHKNKKRRRR